MTPNRALPKTAQTASPKGWHLGLCLILLAGMVGCSTSPPSVTVSPRGSATPTAALSPSPMVITAAPPQPTAQSTVLPYPPPARTAPATVAGYPQPLSSPTGAGTQRATTTPQPESAQTGSITLSIAFTNDVGGQIDPCG